MKPISGKASLSVLLGAAFLDGHTSSIGPGFMLQTAAFTNDLKADFAFAIIVSVIFQLLHSLMCGPSLAYLKCVVKILRIKYCQGLGYFVAFLISPLGPCVQYRQHWGRIYGPKYCIWY